MSACQKGDFFESAQSFIEASTLADAAPPPAAVERAARPQSAGRDSGRGPRPYPTTASPDFYGSSFNKLSLRSHATTFQEVIGKFDRGQLGGAVSRRSHMSFSAHRKDPDHWRPPSYNTQRVSSNSGALRSRTPEPSLCHHRSGGFSPMSPSSCVTFGELVGKFDRGMFGGALARRSHMTFTRARKTNEPLAAAECGLGELSSYMGESPSRRRRPQSASAAERSLRKAASMGALECDLDSTGRFARSPGMSPGGGHAGDNAQDTSPMRRVPMMPQSLTGK